MPRPSTDLRDAARPLDETLSVAPIAAETNPSLARCTTTTVNALLAHYHRAEIGAAEMPRTGRDCLNVLGRRGLTYQPVNFDPPVTVHAFAQMHQRGTWFIGTQNHAMALIDGALVDTARQGLDGRIVQIAAQVGPVGMLRVTEAAPFAAPRNDADTIFSALVGG